MKQYVIFGDSAFAARIYKYIKSEQIDKVLCFTNEEKFISTDRIDDLMVVPFERLSEFYNPTTFELLICVGYADMNRLREKLFTLCKNAGYKIGTWISSTVIAYSGDVAEGNIIMPGVLIGPGVKIGKCNIFESNTCLTHDNLIGDFNFISSHCTFGGNAVVKNFCFIGLNATIKSSITIADYSLLGMGCVQNKGTDPLCVYVGNPSRKLENRSSLDTKI